MIFRSEPIKVKFANGRQCFVTSISPSKRQELIKRFKSEIIGVSYDGTGKDQVKKTPDHVLKNKRKRTYPTGRAWQKEHYNHNKSEKSEVAPENRKHEVRNRNTVNVLNSEVASRMEKISTMKSFATKVRNFPTPITRVDLEKILPDYVSGQDITKVLSVKKKAELGAKVDDFNFGGGIFPDLTKNTRSQIMSAFTAGKLMNPATNEPVTDKEEMYRMIYLADLKQNPNKYAFKVGGEVGRDNLLDDYFEMRSKYYASLSIDKLRDEYYNAYGDRTEEEVEGMSKKELIADLEEQDYYLSKNISDDDLKIAVSTNNPHHFKAGGKTKGKRRTKAEMMHARYVELVNGYKWFIVDLEKSRAIDGYEFKEDAVETLEGDFGKFPKEQKTHRVMSERSLATAGIENPKKRWTEEHGLGGLIGAALAMYVGYKIGRMRPQKMGFETEKKIGRKIGKAAASAKERLSEAGKRAEMSYAARTMAKGGGVESDFSGEYVSIRDFVNSNNGMDKILSEKYKLPLKEVENNLDGELGYDEEVIRHLLRGQGYSVKFVDDNQDGYFKITKRKMEKGGYIVFNYTDNIPAAAETFKTKKAANDFIKEFRKRYEAQGYYRDNRWRQIKPADIDLEVIPSDFNPYR